MSSSLHFQFLCGAGFWLFLTISSAELSARDFYVDGSNPHSRDYLTNGSKQVPFKTIAAASRVAKAGDTVNVLPCTYRETIVPLRSGTEKFPITYQAVGDGVWVKGSEVVTGWLYNSGSWVKRPWHPRFPGSFPPKNPDVEPPFQAQAHSEQVFLDGTPLKWCADLGSLVEGGFYWAVDGSEIALKLPKSTDPNQHLVEIPVREAVVAAWPATDIPMTVAEATKDGKSLAEQGLPAIDWIVIRGFNFAHSLGLINRSGLRIQGEHWLLDENTVEWMNATGIQTDNYATLRGNITRYNGQSGYGAGNGGTKGVHMERNASLWDNSAFFSPGTCGAGLKCVVTSDFSVKDHLTIGAYGSGIWFDWKCSNTVIENCIVLSNAGGEKGGSHGGIFIEFSDGVQIKNNLVFGNFKDSGNGPFGAGIMISSTSNVTASGNIVLFSQGGFGIVGGPVDKLHPFYATNVSISDNLILGTYSFPFAFRLPSSFATASNNQLVSNSIIASAPDARYVLDLREMPTLAGAEAASNGTLTINQEFPDVDPLTPEARQMLSDATFRIVSALGRVGLLEGGMPKTLTVEKIWNFNGSASRGLLLEEGGGYMVFVSNPTDTSWGIAVPTKADISVFHSSTGKWKKASVDNGQITCTAPAGLTIVRGLPANSSPQ